MARRDVTRTVAFVSCLVVGIATSLLVAGSTGAQPKPLWDKILESGELVCGAMPSSPLNSWKVDGPAVYEGYSINLCRQMAVDLSIAMKKYIDLKFRETTWSTVVLDLQAGKVDMWAGMSETEERKKAIDMAGPLYALAHCIVNKKDLAGLSTWEQYSRPEVRIAAVTGTTDEKAVRELAPKATLFSFKDNSEAILAVQAGRADGFGTNVLTCLDILKIAPAVFGEVVIPTPIRSLPSSAGMRKDGDGRFRKWVQQWAEESRASGKVRWLIMDAMKKAGFDIRRIPSGFAF